MEQELNQYVFINSQTGNVIAYLSLSPDLDEQERTKKLEWQKATVATCYKLDVELIYWQYPNRAIV